VAEDKDERHADVKGIKKKDSEIRGSVKGWVLLDWLCYYTSILLDS
jgi:hypothetical protein